MQTPELKKHILPVITGAIVCSVMVAFLTTTMAYIEFNYAGWTRSPHSLPAIAELFRTVYLAGWALPALTILCSIYLVRKLQNKTVNASIVVLLAIAHLGWFFFTMLAFYLTNQTFVGIK